MCCHVVYSADLGCHVGGHLSSRPCLSSVHHSEASLVEPTAKLEGIVGVSIVVEAGGFGQDNLDCPM